MGGAGISIREGLKPVLGEINISQRVISQVPMSRRAIAQYVADYNAKRAEFLADIDLDELLKYAHKDVKQQQKVLRAETPGIASKLDERWHTLTDYLFREIEAGEPQPGVYSFVQRVTFGNAVRLTPTGDAFNMAWHIGKLKQAIQFDPHAWCDELVAMKWRPEVYPCWQDAIAAIRNPAKCYLLLDPPYIEGDGDRKMTPCYKDHKVTTDDGRAGTYALAIEPLKVGLSRGFPLIHLTNYYSQRLDNDVTQMAIDAGYLCDRQMLGICGALGNSNGRLEHGGRVDDRPQPIECLWTFTPPKQISLF